MPTRTLTRSIPARVLTPVGWLEGTFVLPKLHAFAEHVERSESFLRLHGVKLPGRKQPAATFVLQRNAVIAIVPEGERLERDDDRATRLRDHRISCLLERGVIHGTLRIAAGLAVDAFLLHHGGFVVVHDAVIQAGPDAKPTPRLGHVVVNAAHVIGVAED